MSYTNLPKTLRLLITLFLVMLVLLFGAKFINEVKNSKFIGQGVAPTNTINVSAKGEVFVKPDIAKVTLSVVKEAKTALEAQEQATQAINTVVEFLKESGIEDKDVKTTSYSLQPRYDYLRDEGRILRGYVVRQSLEVKIRNIDDAGKIMTGATEAGADQVGNLSLTIDDEEEIKNEARQIDITKAKDKAKKLAQELDVDLSRLVNFYESGGIISSPVRLTLESLDSAISGGVPEIPSGENKITVNVTLTYEIK